jgi:hypothetical protein
MTNPPAPARRATRELSDEPEFAPIRALCAELWPFECGAGAHGLAAPAAKVKLSSGQIGRAPAGRIRTCATPQSPPPG